MKKSIIYLSALFLSVAAFFTVVSCETEEEPLESCVEATLTRCNDTKATACTTEDDSYYKYDGKEYATEDDLIDFLNTEGVCTVNGKKKLSEEEINQLRIELELLMEIARDGLK